MKKLILWISILFFQFSCQREKDLYYSFDTQFGLEIVSETGKDLLSNDLIVEQITISGNNTKGASPTGGLLTPDVPPFESFSLEKIGLSHVLSLTFDPIYSESVLVIKWKDFIKRDTLTAELYNNNNVVYIRQIFWNGTSVYLEERNENKNAIKIEKNL